jgi:hypothetical protein
MAFFLGLADFLLSLGASDSGSVVSAVEVALSVEAAAVSGPEAALSISAPLSLANSSSLLRIRRLVAQQEQLPLGCFVQDCSELLSVLASLVSLAVDSTALALLTLRLLRRFRRLLIFGSWSSSLLSAYDSSEVVSSADSEDASEYSVSFFLSADLSGLSKVTRLEGLGDLGCFAFFFFFFWTDRPRPRG